jgi:hypothetical protein
MGVEKPATVEPRPVFDGTGTRSDNASGVSGAHTRLSGISLHTASDGALLIQAVRDVRYHVRVLDCAGRLLHSSTMTETARSRIPLSSHYGAGIYSVIVQHGGEIMSRRIAVQ